MKINDIFSGQQNGNKAAGKQESSPEVRFKDLLKRLQPTAGGFDVSEAKEISTSSSVSANLRLEGLTLTEKTIDTLESFGAALADSRLTAEDIEPFVSSLEEETAALAELKEELPQDDPLAKLLDRVATITYLETAKYRRGDYSA